MTIEQRLPEPWRRRLYLPAYSTSTAARYAGAPVGTVTYWHYSSSSLDPALPGKERRVPLSYLQLIEVAFVATFRNLGFSLQKIRRTREYAAQVLEAEFPFAQLKWWTEGHNLLLQLKDVEPKTHLDGLIITNTAGQVAWSPLVDARFIEFEYQDGLAIQWHVGGKESPVLIDPRVSYGAPMVKGVPTWALKGRSLAGEPVSEIAQDFGISEPDVKAALTFEGVQPAA